VVRGGRERGVSGLPVLVEGWAGGKGSVRGVVVRLLCASGSCTGELLGEVAVIGAGLDLTVVDGDEPCFSLETCVKRHE
jgi:hypothetical protein